MPFITNPLTGRQEYTRPEAPTPNQVARFNEVQYNLRLRYEAELRPQLFKPGRIEEIRAASLTGGK